MAKKEDSGIAEEPEEIRSKKPKASVRRVKKEQDSDTESAVNAKPKRSRVTRVKPKKEIVDDTDGSDAILPPKKTGAPRRKGAAVVERPPTDEEDGDAFEPGSKAKTEQSDESGSAFEGVDEPQATNGRIKKESRSVAAKALPKKVKAATSAKQFCRSNSSKSFS